MAASDATMYSDDDLLESSIAKAQEELELHVGDRQVTESDIKDLVYLQAVVKETLRLYPAAFLGGPRVFSEDCTIAGYHVPKGTWLLINMWKLPKGLSHSERSGKKMANSDEESLVGLSLFVLVVLSEMYHI
ncbi:cytochrome P450 CYP82D47-like protein [Tanacetum coccineum]